jgi:hypothetical protein
MKKLLELITGDDNVTLEPAYVWWAVAIIAGLALEGYSVYSGHTFDMTAYGVGMGGLLAGAGFGRKLGS